MERSSADITFNHQGVNALSKSAVNLAAITGQDSTEDLVEIIRYFGIFNYPLTIEEIYHFSGSQYSLTEIKKLLEVVQHRYGIHQHGVFYYWGDDVSCIEKRLTGEQLALKALPKALRVGRFISRFPFVTFVGISGSLSKGYATARSDFDYFIITSNNTLWICRTILHLFKKVSFIFGLQHWFCMNYFIDHNHLEIEEKNVFTKMELMTMIPVRNSSLYQYFMLKNNTPNINKLQFDIPKSSFIKAYEDVYVREKNKWLRPLNNFLMRITDRKWKKKWAKMNFPMDEYPLCFKTTPFISKNHPKNYQKRILETFHQH